MAAFVARTLEAAGVGLPEPADQGFADIRGHTHEADINRLAAGGIVSGRTAVTFEPSVAVRRDQAASFVLRALALATGVELTDLHAATDSFTDVSSNNVHRANIGGAAQLGLVHGRTAATFEPSKPIRRDQMASLVVRLLVHLEGRSPAFADSPHSREDGAEDSEDDAQTDAPPVTSPSPGGGGAPGQPELSEITAQLGVDGGVVQLGQASVVFPPGAFLSQATVTIRLVTDAHEPGDPSTGEPVALGAQYEIAASEPLQLPVALTLPVDLTGLPAVAHEAVFLQHQDQDGNVEYLPATLDPTAGTLTSNVSNFSFFQPFLNVAQWLLLSASDFLTESIGFRTTQPSCSDTPPANHYELLDPGAEVAEPPLLLCVQRMGDELALKVRNNRAYAMRLDADGESLSHMGAENTGSLFNYAVGQLAPPPPLALSGAEHHFLIPADVLGTLSYSIDPVPTIIARGWAAAEDILDLEPLTFADAVFQGIRCTDELVGSGASATQIVGAGFTCIDAVVDAIPVDATSNVLGLSLNTGAIAAAYAKLMFTAQSTGLLYDLTIDVIFGGGSLTLTLHYHPPPDVDPSPPAQWIHSLPWASVPGSILAVPGEGVLRHDTSSALNVPEASFWSRSGEHRWELIEEIHAEGPAIAGPGVVGFQVADDLAAYRLYETNGNQLWQASFSEGQDVHQAALSDGHVYLLASSTIPELRVLDAGSGLQLNNFTAPGATGFPSVRPVARGVALLHETGVDFYDEDGLYASVDIPNASFVPSVSGSATSGAVVLAGTRTAGDDCLAQVALADADGLKWQREIPTSPLACVHRHQIFRGAPLPNGDVAVLHGAWTGGEEPLLQVLHGSDGTERVSQTLESPSGLAFDRHVALVTGQGGIMIVGRLVTVCGEGGQAHTCWGTDATVLDPTTLALIDAAFLFEEERGGLAPTSVAVDNDQVYLAGTVRDEQHDLVVQLHALPLNIGEPFTSFHPV